MEFPRSVQLVARNRQSRTEVESPRSVQLVARKNTLKNHRTSFRTEVESFVHQDARYNMNLPFYINWLSAHAVKRAPLKVSKIKES